MGARSNRFGGGGAPGMEWEPDLIGLEAIQAPGSKKLEGKSGL